MEFGLLGPLEVSSGGEDLAITAPKQRALLVLLLLHRGHVVTPDRILDELWPGEPPTGGLKTVRFHVSKLRTALDAAGHGTGFSVIETRRSGYCIDATRHDVDIDRFETLAANAGDLRISQPERALRLYLAALELWRGAPLLDVMYEPFAAEEIHRLESVHEGIAEERIAVEMRLGRSLDLIPGLEAMVHQHPLRQRPVELLMRALYTAGRPAEAITMGNQLRTRLADVGLDPAPSLSELEDQILLHGPAIETHDRNSPLPLGSAPFPVAFNSFIGRTEELREIETLVRDSRLVTLVGPPGSGKTRLGLAAASQLAGTFTDGAVMIHLSDIADPDLVPQAVGTALGITETWDTHYTTLLLSALRDRHALLVLDNCEHLLGDTARLVLTVLQGCPHITILATSREPFSIPGEQAWAVPPFPVPPPEADTVDEIMQAASVQLYVDRAEAASRSFRMDDTTAPVVAMICRRLDGLPLAIELAAASSHTMTPGQILERLGERFVSLPAVPRPAVPRQETMGTAIQWSIDLLSARDRMVFRRLAVFAGGITMEAAEAVAGWGTVARGDVFDAVINLVHKSLLVVEPTRTDQIRYRMLTVLRQFGQRELRECDEHHETDRRHAEHFANVAEAVSPFIEGPHQDLGRDLADLEIDNFRGALEWSLSSANPAPAMRITAALTWFWYWRSYLNEARQWTGRTLQAAPSEPSAERGGVYYAAGIFNDILAYYDEADRLFDAAITEADVIASPSLRSRSLTGRGVVARDRGDHRASLVHLEEAAAIVRERGLDFPLALTLRFSGVVRFLGGDPLGGREALEEALAIFERHGHEGGMAWTMAGLGRIDMAFDPSDTRRIHTAHDIFARIDDKRGRSWALFHMAESHYSLGAFDAITGLAEEALGQFSALSDRRGIPYAVTMLGAAALGKGDLDRSAANLRQAQNLFDEIGDMNGTGLVLSMLARLAIIDRRWATVEEHLGGVHQLGSAGRPWLLLSAAREVARGLRDIGADAGRLETVAAAIRTSLLAGDTAGVASHAGTLRTLLPTVLHP